jgi:hypothetical protein
MFLLVLLCILLMASNNTTRLPFPKGWDHHHNKNVVVSRIPYSGPASGTEWWEAYVDYLARHFPHWSGKKEAYGWCVVSKENDSELSGLLFVKNYKAASSTGAGITVHMAHTIRARTATINSTTCSYRASHAFADDGDHTNPRHTDRSWLWTIVRHPASRVWSGYFYFRDGPRQPANAANVRMYAQSEKSAQVAYLDTWRNDWDATVLPNPAAARIQRSILHAYDFVAIQERMDESLVVLKMLLDLEDFDIIVLPAKQSGSYAMGPNGSCRIVNPTRSLPELEDYFKTDFPNNNYDYLLYAAANRSLDTTIDITLGRERVAQEVQKHKRLQRFAQGKCRPEAFFPCSSTGKLQLAASKESCYHQDWGCGYQCLDRLARDYKEGKLEGLY